MNVKTAKFDGYIWLMGTPPRRIRIMLVCMVNSIHVARWISQFDSKDYEFFLIPSTPTRKSHPEITKLSTTNGNIKVSPFGGKLSQFLWGFDLVLGNKLRSALMRYAYRRYMPDLVHALEFQHGAYLAEQALRTLPRTVPFIATCYGSDIFWFKNYPRHLRRIKSVLSRADFYSAECHRDVLLAKEFGFSGIVLPVIPNAGGMPPKFLEAPLVLPRDRRLVMIKGYDSWVGRGSKAVQAISQIAGSLNDFEFIVYSAERRTRAAIRKLPSDLRARFTVFKKGKLPHVQVMNYFGRALLYIGVSESDGISTSLLEALAMGCYPVQTNTACTNEWFRNGLDGVEISSITTESIAEDIKRALGLALQLPETEWERRLTQVRIRLDFDSISQVAQTYYKAVMANLK
jgi:glycosyltransferase involved in cell wall biosynthesis